MPDSTSKGKTGSPGGTRRRRPTLSDKARLPRTPVLPPVQADEAGFGLPEAIVARLAETFSVLGDPSRLRIIHALSLRELCVGDLARLLSVSPSAVSHQLRLLRNLRLVKFRREGKVSFYSLDDDHVISLISQGLAHVLH